MTYIMCSNGSFDTNPCLNGGHCSLTGQCLCASACFLGNACEINYNAVRLPMTGAIIQDTPSSRDGYILIFVLLAVSGLINNTLALSTFVRERIRVTVLGIYLILFSLMGLALTITLLSYIFTIIRYNNDTYRLLACHGIPFVSLIMIDGSILCTVAVAIERVLIECFNFSIHGSRLRGLGVSLFIIVYACISNVDEIFLRRIRTDLVGKPVCTYDFEGHPTSRRIDVVFSYAHVVIPCVTHLIATVCVLTSTARRKIFIGCTNERLYRVWMHQLYLRRDFLIPPLCLIVCILLHGILGHLLQTCIPYSDKVKLRLHISFVLLHYVPQMMTFLLYVYPNEIYMGEFQNTSAYRRFCSYFDRHRRHFRRLGIQRSSSTRMTTPLYISDEML